MKQFLLALWLALALPAFAVEPAQVSSTIVVPAASTIQGVAGTATAITYTISGVEQQGGVQTPKTLAQGQLPTSPGILYTGPAGVVAYIASISLINTTGSSVSGIKLFTGGNAAANQILNSLTIPANGQAVYNGTGWKVTDANGATESVSTGGTAYFAGTGLAQVGTTFSIFPSTSVSWNSQRLTSLADGVDTEDAVNLSQLTAAINGQKLKASVDWSTTASITLSGLSTQAGGEWPSTLAPTVDDPLRILVKNQSSSADDGIYNPKSGAWVRTSDAATGSEISHASTLVEFGAQSGDTWNQSLTVSNIAADPQDWVLTGNGASYTADESTLHLSVSSVFSELDAGTSNAKLANMPQATFKMRAAAAGTGVPIDGTATQAKAALAIANTDVSGLGTLSTQNGVFSGSSAGTNTGDVSLGTFGSTPNAKGLTLTGQSLVGQPADGSNPGFLTAGAQTIGGVKTFGSAPVMSGASITNATVPTAALTGALQAAQEPAHTGGVTNTAGSLALTVVTNANLTGGVTSVGNAATVVTNANLTGPVTSVGNATTITPTISAGGPTGSPSVVPVVTWNAAGQLTAVTTAAVTPAAIGAPSGSGSSTGTNTGDVTLGAVGASPNVNGASLSGQVLTLQPASVTQPGLITAAYQAFLNAYKDKGIVLVTANQYANIACDGSTDDAAQWNALAAAAPADSVLRMPTCTSLIKSAITTTKHFAFKGNGQGRSIIRSASATADFLTLGDWYSTVEGIEFDGLNTTVTSAVALSGVGVSLLVGSTANFPASGQFYVQTNLGWTLASYASITDGTHFGTVTAAASTTVAGGPITVKTAGNAINAQAMNHVFVKDVWFNYVYNGWRSDGTICGLLDSQIFGEVNFGVQLNGPTVNDIIHNVTADGIPPAVAHLEVNQAGSLLLSDNDLIRAQSDMRLNPTSPNGVFGVYVVNTYFDTATGVSGTANSGNGVLLQGTGNIQRIKIINSWLSSATHDGFWANSTAATLPTDIELSGNNIYSNGHDGVNWLVGQDFIISANQISGNVNAGVDLTASAGAVTTGAIQHNQIGPAGGIGANGTGLIVNAGTYGNLDLDYNDLAGNTTAAQTGFPPTITVPNMAVIAGNTGLFTCPPDESPAAVLPLTTVTRAGSNPCVIRPGARVGSWARITTTMTHLASSTATLSTVLKLGTANSNADATLFTPTALGAGTAVAGSCQDIYEFTIVSNTTVNVVHKWVNGNGNAATTGCGGAAAQNAATAPVTITSIASGGPYYLAPYYACTVASCETIQSVSYEYGQ